MPRYFAFLVGVWGFRSYFICRRTWPDMWLYAYLKLPGWAVGIAVAFVVVLERGFFFELWSLHRYLISAFAASVIAWGLVLHSRHHDQDLETLSLQLRGDPVPSQKLSQVLLGWGLVSIVGLTATIAHAALILH